MENNSNPINNTVSNPEAAPQPQPMAQPQSQPPVQPQPQIPPQPNIVQPGIKSSTVAGLLGILLGTVGAHNWYLGENKKGIIHLAIAGAGFLINFIGGVIMPSSMGILDLYRMGGLLAAMTTIGWMLIAASEVWGFIEGVQILSQGDAGLAAKGYTVAALPQAGSTPNSNINDQNNINNQNGVNNGR